MGVANHQRFTQYLYDKLQKTKEWDGSFPLKLFVWFRQASVSGPGHGVICVNMNYYWPQICPIVPCLPQGFAHSFDL
jgi:hypothetical protein